MDKYFFNWLNHSDVRQIIIALSVQSTPTFQFVGGCVRDSLLGKCPTDFDIASTLTPEKNIQLLQQHNIKVILFALKYGTVIAKLSKYSFEITTLRVDVTSYGRHAQVKFNTSYKEDAKRRDFTINALYLHPTTVQITDYFNGIQDLKSGKINFIGDMELRIQEDYLRILRFIRFYTQLGKKPVTSVQIKTLKLYCDKLLKLSKERITVELNKIINHQNATKGLKLLNKLSIPLILFKQQNLYYNKLCKLNNLANSNKFKILPLLKWLVLTSSTNSVIHALNFSKKDMKYIKKILLINTKLKFKYKASYFLARYEKFILINSILLALIKYCTSTLYYSYLKKLLLEVQTKSNFDFCISGKDLINLNLNPGKMIGIKLLQLKEWGIENSISSKIEYLNKAKELIKS